MDYGRIIQKKRIKCYEVADNVFAAISPYRGISWANAGFINKGPGLVYDTFFDLFHAREMQEVYEDVSGRVLPAYVVNSHYNCDHTYGNKVFRHSCIIMHKNADKERLTESIEWQDGLIKRGKDSLESTPGERFLAEQYEGFDLTGVEWIKPSIEIDHDINIHLGDTEVNIINVAPSHSNSDLLAWMPKEKVLFTGDIIFPGCSAYTEEGIMNWVNVLERIITEIKPKVVVPGHGKICDLGFVQEQRDYLVNLIDQFNKYYDDEIDSISLALKFDISKYLHWIQPERVWSSVDAMVKSKRGLSMIPNWDTIPENLKTVRGLLEKKYPGQIPEWDPMSAWEE